MNKDNEFIYEMPRELIDEFEDTIRMDMQEIIINERNRRWQLFINNKKSQWKSQVEELKITLPCAKDDAPYLVTIPAKHGDFVINYIVILDKEKHNITVNLDKTNDVFCIQGTPHLENVAPVNLNVQLVFSHHKWLGTPIAAKLLKLTVNPNPNRLWRDLPVPENTEYPKVNEECDFINPDDLYIQNVEQKLEQNQLPVKLDETVNAHHPAKCIIAASKRGRSHAHEAKPRDDHYSINFSDDKWYLAVVADGAGSAPFSREGSRIACETASRVCLNQLNQENNLMKDILTLNDLRKVENCDELQVQKARKLVGDGIYKILGWAALQSFSEIKSVANAKNRKAKDYATTLLIAIAKQISDNRWFIATFWVGDGAIGLYDEHSHSVKLLCKPDEGEFSGQTRFVTMPEIFASAEEIYKRLRFCIVDDFSSLLLMTDGVSDAFFETVQNLEDPDKWQNLVQNINLALKEEDSTLPSTDIQAERLLKFLDFWSVGNHDDRTIVIIQ